MPYVTPTFVRVAEHIVTHADAVQWAGCCGRKMAAMSAIFDLLVNQRRSAHISPAVLLDPVDVDKAFGISPPSSGKSI